MDFESDVASLRSVLWSSIQARPAPVAMAALLEVALNVGLQTLGLHETQELFQHALAAGREASGRYNLK